MDKFNAIINQQCPYKQTCDFESGLCDWTPVPANGTYYWSIAPATNLYKSLSIGDHTTETQYGHTLETNSNAPVNNIAVLQSGVFPKTIGTQCLQFWFLRRPNISDVIEVFLQNNGGVKGVSYLYFLLFIYY